MIAEIQPINEKTPLLAGSLFANGTDVRLLLSLGFTQTKTNQPRTIGLGLLVFFGLDYDKFSGSHMFTRLVAVYHMI